MVEFGPGDEAYWLVVVGRRSEVRPVRDEAVDGWDVKWRIPAFVLRAVVRDRFMWRDVAISNYVSVTLQPGAREILDLLLRRGTRWNRG